MKPSSDLINISTDLGIRRFMNELRRNQETNKEINLSRLCVGLMRDGLNYRKRQELCWVALSLSSISNTQKISKDLLSKTPTYCLI